MCIDSKQSSSYLLYFQTSKVSFVKQFYIYCDWMLSFSLFFETFFLWSHSCVPCDCGRSIIYLSAYFFLVSHFPVPWYVFLHMTQKAKPHSEQSAALLDFSKITAEPQDVRGQYVTSVRQKDAKRNEIFMKKS